MGAGQDCGRTHAGSARQDKRRRKRAILPPPRGFFAPICAAAQAPWGRKAFAAYLGDNPAAWLAHDATALIAQPLSERLPLLVDQGEADEFLPQLRPDLLQAACERAGHPLTLRMHAGHDHSYYFMASFMADHMAHHAAALRAP